MIRWWNSRIAIGTGGLEKTLAPFGKFLDIHQLSLSPGDGPFMPLRRGDMDMLCHQVGAAQTTAQGGHNHAD